MLDSATEDKPRVLIKWFQLLMSHADESGEWGASNELIGFRKL